MWSGALLEPWKGLGTFLGSYLNVQTNERPRSYLKPFSPVLGYLLHSTDLNSFKNKQKGWMVAQLAGAAQTRLKSGEATGCQSSQAGLVRRWGSGFEAGCFLFEIGTLAARLASDLLSQEGDPELQG